MKIRPYSFSGISTFNDCPKKFKLNYVDKIRIDDDAYPLRRGRYLHESLEFHNTDNKANESDLNPQELSECKETLQIFSKSKYYKKYLEVPGESELHFALNAELKPVDYTDKEAALIRGKIDKVISVNDTELVAIDWKSGKVPNPPDYQQLSLYAAYLFVKYPNIKSIYCTYVYLDHDTEIAKTFKREEYSNLILPFIRHIKTIESQIFFKANPSWKCNWCKFKKAGICIV